MRSMTVSTPRCGLVLTLAVPMHSMAWSKMPSRILVPPRSTPTTYSALLPGSAMWNLFSRQHRADFFAQFSANHFRRAHSVHDGKAVSRLQVPEGFLHGGLVVHETVKHIAGQS